MTTWALEPRDTLALAVGYLAGLMPDCTVASRVQSRTMMVSLSEGGGSRTNHVLDSGLLIVHGWDPDALEARRICTEAFTHLLSIREDPACGKYVREVEGFGLPGRYDDADSNTPRYQATVRISLRPIGAQE